MRYLGRENFSHASPPAVGVLLVNLGTPQAPSKQALKPYLAEFLADPRVIELPRFFWRLVLHGIILRRRPKASAELYKRVWTSDGSPLLLYTKAQAGALREQLSRSIGTPLVVDFAMRYGQPSIEEVVKKMLQQNVQKLLFLPLYPQYSAACNASSFDALSRYFQRLRWLPELRTIMQYHDHPLYIKALAASLREHWEKHGRAEKLLMSFHGIPKSYFEAGDPYHCHCYKTARLLAESLELKREDFQVSFQSRFGRSEWLQPYTDKTLISWGEEGLRSVDVICPGFSADCLETLEEICEENKHYFQEAGGGSFSYIPALNDRPDFIEALAAICKENLHGWVKSLEEYDAEGAIREGQERERRASALSEESGAKAN